MPDGNTPNEKQLAEALELQRLRATGLGCTVSYETPKHLAEQVRNAETVMGEAFGGTYSSLPPELIGSGCSRIFGKKSGALGSVADLHSLAGPRGVLTVDVQYGEEVERLFAAHDNSSRTAQQGWMNGRIREFFKALETRAYKVEGAHRTWTWGTGAVLLPISASHDEGAPRRGAHAKLALSPHVVTLNGRLERADLAVLRDTIEEGELFRDKVEKRVLDYHRKHRAVFRELGELQERLTRSSEFFGRQQEERSVEEARARERNLDQLRDFKERSRSVGDR